MLGAPRFWCLTLMVILISAKTTNAQGIEVSLDRDFISVDETRQSAELTCKANGNTVKVRSVAVIWVKNTGETNEFLKVTQNTPKASVSHDGVLGKGTLNGNNGRIVLEQIDAEDCQSSYFLCEVMYDKPSGGVDRAIATAWPRYPQTGVRDSNYTSDLPALQKRAEDVTAALQMLNMSYTYLKATQQKEREAQVKIMSRLKKLENMSSSASESKPSTCDPCSNLTQTLKNLEKRLDALDNTSKPTEAPVEKSDCRLSRLKNCYQGMSADTNEPYLLMLDRASGVPIRCDAQTDGGGWIVFQRRAVLDVDFPGRSWEEYRNGFGNISTDFWLGNKLLHSFTSQDIFELRVDMVATTNTTFYNVYETFNVSSESEQFRLYVSPLTDGSLGETPGQGMSYHNNMKFTTADRDNDNRGINCATSPIRGAFWHNSCARVVPNSAPAYIQWTPSSLAYYLSFIEMKMRCRKNSD